MRTRVLLSCLLFTVTVAARNSKDGANPANSSSIITNPPYLPHEEFDYPVPVVADAAAVPAVKAAVAKIRAAMAVAQRSSNHAEGKRGGGSLQMGAVEASMRILVQRGAEDDDYKIPIWTEPSMSIGALKAAIGLKLNMMPIDGSHLFVLGIRLKDDASVRDYSHILRDGGIVCIGLAVEQCKPKEADEVPPAMTGGPRELSDSFARREKAQHDAKMNEVRDKIWRAEGGTGEIG